MNTRFALAPRPRSPQAGQVHDDMRGLIGRPPAAYQIVGDKSMAKHFNRPVDLQSG
jgi:hypothetical protein